MSYSANTLAQSQSAQIQTISQAHLCVECLDHPSVLLCKSCEDEYCDLCFAQLHRFGFRSHHEYEMLEGRNLATAHLNIVSTHTTDSSAALSSAVAGLNTGLGPSRLTALYEAKNVKKESNDDNTDDSNTKEDDGEVIPSSQDQQTTSSSSSSSSPPPLLPPKRTSLVDFDTYTSTSQIPSQLLPAIIFYPELSTRIRYIPLRLSEEERQLLSILESALQISEYTDKIDVLGLRDRPGLILEETLTVLNLISALYIANDYKKGQKRFCTGLSKDSESVDIFARSGSFFQKIFEVGRRHKIRNPDKMRSTYGKMMAICTDSKTSSVRRTLGYDLTTHIRTVYQRLEYLGIQEIINDPILSLAVLQVDVHSPGLATQKLSSVEKNKIISDTILLRQQATEYLANKYSHMANAYISSIIANEGLKSGLDAFPDWPLSLGGPNQIKVVPDDLNLILLSICDAHSYLYQCLTPLQRMHQRLDEYFGPDPSSAPLSLAITSGKEGSRLTHSHTQQYTYVHQTFMLWETILLHIYQLWMCADVDMLNGWTASGQNSSSINYSLRFNGQYLARMQACPNVGNVMHRLLGQVQASVGGRWHGSSAIHLGDSNVPNSLIFIDKYTQIERMLAPLDRTIRQMEEVVSAGSSHPLYQYFQQYYLTLFPNTENTLLVHVRVMADYFKHAFNGSGADDYFSAGSCIDGRLTSSWEWTNVIHKKAYYQAFLATGFTGFDG